MRKIKDYSFPCKCSVKNSILVPFQRALRLYLLQVTMQVYKTIELTLI